MADFLSWVQSNWSSTIGAAGIIGSLCYTAASFRQDSKARQVSNLLALDERHRVLWNDAHQRPDLKRIFTGEIDLVSEPPSVAEEEFLRLATIHFETGWRLERLMDRRELEALALDAGEFFSLPLPRAVWEKTKKIRNQQFVRFVERALGR
jgi:hypothetical protein